MSDLKRCPYENVRQMDWETAYEDACQILYDQDLDRSPTHDEIMAQLDKIEEDREYSRFYGV